MTKRLITIEHEYMGMRKPPIVSKALHELITGPYLLGVILLFLGLMTVEPVLTMAGSVILIGMAFISIKYGN